MSSTREYYLPIHKHGQPGAGCGCEIAGCCLQCPLPICKYENGKARARLQSAARDREIANLLRQGLSRAKVAYRFGIGLRTLERAVTRYEEVEKTGVLVN